MEVRGQNHTPAALPMVGEPRDPLKNGTVDPRADRDVMEKKKSVAPAGEDSNCGPSIYYYVCGVTHYFLGATNRERHDQKA